MRSILILMILSDNVPKWIERRIDTRKQMNHLRLKRKSEVVRYRV